MQLPVLGTVLSPEAITGLIAVVFTGLAGLWKVVVMWRNKTVDARVQQAISSNEAVAKMEEIASQHTTKLFAIYNATIERLEKELEKEGERYRTELADVKQELIKTQDVVHALRTENAKILLENEALRAENGRLERLLRQSDREDRTLGDSLIR